MKKIKKFALSLFAVCLGCAMTFSVGCKKDDAPPPAEPTAQGVATDPVMPVAFLDGIEYPIPEATFVDDESKVLTYSVYMIDEAGSESLLSGKSFTPSVYVHGKNIGLKYVIQTDEGNIVKEYSVPVLKATSVEGGKTYYSFDKMFVTSNVESTALTEAGTVFYGSRDFSATYANALDASFTINLKSLSGYDNFGAVTMTITDARDPSTSVHLSVSPASDGSTSTSLISVNGGTPVSMSGSFKDFENGFKLSFNNNTAKLFDVLNAELATVSETVDGEAFSGFKSGLVNVSVGLSAPRATSAVTVVNINNQAMTTAASRDRISPLVVCSEDIVIINNLKDRITVPKALAFDVLDPNTTTAVSVYTPDGEYAKTADGTEIRELDASAAYVFVADALGEYTIQYSAKDRNGNRYDNGWYSVFIVDSVAPSLTVKSPVKESVSVGTEVTISELEYSDDCSTKENIDVLITVHLHNGDYKVVKSGDKFKFEKAGTYYFRYTVIDEYYNMTTVSQTVICK